MDFCAPYQLVANDSVSFSTKAEVDAARGRRNDALKVLIAGASGGDVIAFETLYTTTAPWLLSTIRRITGMDHCEDVLAEVYLQVWRSLSSYEESRGEPLAWLTTIARSRALDCLRIERRNHGGKTELPGSQPEEGQHSDGPEQLLAAQEEAELVRAALGALSSKERLVLGMAYFRDCSQAEIATLTGFPLGTVKTLMTRCQRKLRVVLGPAVRAESTPYRHYHEMAVPATG